MPVTHWEITFFPNLYPEPYFLPHFSNLTFISLRDFSCWYMYNPWELTPILHWEIGHPTPLEAFVSHWQPMAPQQDNHKEFAMDDLVGQKILNAYLGTLVLDVQYLSIEWKTGCNWALQKNHVQKLMEEFQTGIRWYTVHECLWVTMGPNDFQTYLKAHHISEHDKPPMPSQLCKLSANATIWSEKPGELISVFNLPAESDTPLPILQGGQHCCVALLSLCKEQVDVVASGVKIDGKPVPFPTAHVSTKLVLTISQQISHWKIV